MANRYVYLRRLRHWLANRGWKGVLQELWYRAKLKLKGNAVPGQEKDSTVPHPFDQEYDVDTGGLIWGESLGRPSSRDAAYWATGYYGISPSAFTAAVERLRLDWPRFTFVDIGCGKGRAILLATRFPFRRVMGVELSPELVAVAQENIRKFAAPWRQQGVSAEAITGDATAFPIPDGPLVFYMYHPFAAPIMRRFLAHVQEAARAEEREVYLLYANPELEKLLAETAGVEWLWKETFALTAEEGAADRFGSHGEAFAAYRVRGR
jgi:SAM-dependent methyltransferase